MVSYNYLKQAAQGKMRIGSLKGIEVYACSKYEYDATTSQFYVIYDDGNKLVREGYCYGYINDSGTVNEERATWYNVPSREGDVVTKVVPASGYSAQVITDEFFSKLDKEINELLDNVSKIDLLEGLAVDFKV